MNGRILADSSHILIKMTEHAFLKKKSVSSLYCGYFRDFRQRLLSFCMHICLLGVDNINGSQEVRNV